MRGLYFFAWIGYSLHMMKKIEEKAEALIRKYGAWADRRLIALYEKYAATMFDRYRNLVKYWMTFNEINMSPVG